MGFNSRFTTKPAVAKSLVAKPSVTKPFLNSVDEGKVVGHNLLRSCEQLWQSAAPSADNSRVSSPKITKFGKEELSVASAGGILLLVFSSFPEALPLGVIGRSATLIGALL